MREFGLGLRLLFGPGRGARVRFLLMTLGGSLGVCCLALVLTIPAILDARDGRDADRAPRSFVGRAGGQPGLFLERTDAHGARPFQRVFLAPGRGRPVGPPPGVDRLPRPGEAYVSPALREQFRKEPGLKGLVPGVVRGDIGAAGLAHPQELYAYIGVGRRQIGDAASPLKSFGSPYARSTTVEPSTLDTLRFTMVTLVLLPLAVFLSVCAKLSAASRNRRLAALRLLGVSVKGTLRVNAAETVVAAFLGAVLGLVEFWLLNQIVARTGLPGLKWFPGDGALSASTVAVCVIGAPVLAWFAGRPGARTAARNPLETRRTGVPRPPRPWGGVVLVAGLGLVVGYAATGLTARPVQNTGPHALLMPLGVLLTGLGLVTVMPYLSYVMARRLGRSGRLALSLAMRRNETEPGSTMRVVTGLVLLIFSASLAQGVLVELGQVSRNTSAVQEYRLFRDQLTADQERRLRALSQVHASAILLRSPTDADGSGTDSSADALVATCAQLAGLVRRYEGCVDGRVLRLQDPATGGYPLSHSTYRMTVRGRRADLTLDIPRTTVRFTGHGVTSLPSSGLLVPPSLVPAGARPVAALEQSLVLASDSGPGTVRAVLDRVGTIAPAAEVDPVGVNVEGLQQITVIKTLLALGMVMGLLIGVAAFLVSATDRAVERRGQVAALTLIGAPARTLRAVQCVQVVLPLAAGLSIALVTGKLSESAYLVTGGGAVFWDDAGVPLLLCAAVGVLLAATAGTVPLVGRRVDPEFIRRD